MEETSEPRLCTAKEGKTHSTEIQGHNIVRLEDELVLIFVDKGASIHNPSAILSCLGRGSGGMNVFRNRDLGGLDVFKPDYDVRHLPSHIVCDGMRDKLLFQATEIVVPNVSQQLRPMVFIPDGQRVPPQHVKDFCEDLRRSIRDLGRVNSWWPKKVPGVKSREDITGGAEEDCKTKCEIVGRVAWE